MSMSEIGRRIRVAREKHGMTQRQLARRVGFSAANPISKLETGRSAGIDALLLQRIGQVTDTWLPFLLGESNESRPYVEGSHRSEAGLDFVSLEREVVALRSRLDGLAQELSTVQARPTVNVPVLGRIRAGSLEEAIEHAEEIVALPRWWVRHADRVFLLRVAGRSMSPTLEPGDLAVVSPDDVAEEGDIVVAVVGNEATIKRYHRQRRRILLKADNPSYDDIVVSSQLQINGKVVALLRRFRGV